MLATDNRLPNEPNLSLTCKDRSAKALAAGIKASSRCSMGARGARKKTRNPNFSVNEHKGAGPAHMRLCLNHEIQISAGCKIASLKPRYFVFAKNLGFSC